MRIPLIIGLRNVALGVGVAPEDVDVLWERHIELVDEDGGSYGGPRWKGLCERHVKDMALGVTQDLKVNPGRFAEAESISRRLAWEEARRLRATFEDYLDSLVGKSNLTEAEKLLLDGERAPEEDPVAYMMRTFQRGHAKP